MSTYHNNKDQSNMQKNQFISSIINSALNDVIDMCIFTDKGQSLYEIKKRHKQAYSSTPQMELKSIPFIDYIKINAQAISTITGQSQEQVSENSQLIWKVMNQGEKDYFTNLYRSFEQNQVSTKGIIKQIAKEHTRM